MSQITVTLPDKSTRNFNPGVTPFEIAESIGARLANDALAAQVNRKLVDLNVPIDTDEDVNWEFEQMRAASTIQVYRYGMITGQNIKLFEQGKLDKYLDEIDDKWSEKDADFKQKRDGD